ALSARSTLSLHDALPIFGRRPPRHRHGRAANPPHAKWRMARITVKKIAGALGAEIGGIDLRELSDGDIAAVRAAWLEHLVIFFRDQPLTPAQFMAFAKRIGRPIEYPFVKGIAGFPEIIEVKKLE